MSDETTNPQQPPATSSVGDHDVPSRPSSRVAMLALTVSFCVISTLWGLLLYWCWGGFSVYMAVGRCVVFVVFMAWVHLIGYRLWQGQFAQDKGHGNESALRPISSAYRPAVKTALLQQGIVLVLAALMLDGGLTFNVAVIAVLGYWLGFGVIVVRRPSSPTWGDILLIRYGFLLDFHSHIRCSADCLDSVRPFVNPAPNEQSSPNCRSCHNSCFGRKLACTPPKAQIWNY